MDVTPVNLEGMGPRSDARPAPAIMPAFNNAGVQHHTLAVSTCIHAVVILALLAQHGGLVVPARSVGWVIEPMAAHDRRAPGIEAAGLPAMAPFRAAVLMAGQARFRTASLAGIGPRRSTPAHRTTLHARTTTHPAETVAAASTPAAAPAVAAPLDEAAMTAFEHRISAAIDAAKFYPIRARQLRREGRAVVSLVYHDGTVGNVRLQQSTGNPYLDAGALAAVRQAHYPMPPRALIGHMFELSLPIAFALEERTTG